MKYLVYILLSAVIGCNEKRTTKYFQHPDIKKHSIINRELIKRTINLIKSMDSSIVIKEDSIEFKDTGNGNYFLLKGAPLDTMSIPWLFSVYRYNVYRIICSRQYKSSLYFFQSFDKLDNNHIDSFFSKIDIGFGATSSGFKKFYYSDSIIVMHVCIVDTLENHFCSDSLLYGVQNSLLKSKFELIDVVSRGYGHSSLK